jgi:hypothetical protein
MVARSESDARRTDRVAQLRARSGAGLGKPPNSQDVRIRAGARWRGLWWSGRRSFRRHPNHEPPLQHVILIVGTKPLEPYQSRANHRKHHFAALRSSEPDGGGWFRPWNGWAGLGCAGRRWAGRRAWGSRRAWFWGLLGKREQSATGNASAVHILVRGLSRDGPRTQYIFLMSAFLPIVLNAQ